MINTIVYILIFGAGTALIHKLITNKEFTLPKYTTILLLLLSAFNFLVTDLSAISVIELLFILFIVVLSDFKSARR